MVARGEISGRIVAFSDEAGWGSNGMQKRQALCWAVGTGELVLYLRTAEVCVPYSCPGDAMGSLSLLLALPPSLSRNENKVQQRRVQGLALDGFAGSRGSQFSTAWVARQVQGSQLQAAGCDLTGLGSSGPSFP